MRERPLQQNCQIEPSYPDHETVIASIRDPELTCHLPQERCTIQEPHRIAECGLWASLGYPVKLNKYGDALLPGIFDFETGRIT